MTDIEEMYLAEAVRRLNAAASVYKYSTVSWGEVDFGHPTVTAFAATLKELGWKPPIDEARMAKARKVAAAVLWVTPDFVALERVQAAYDALGED